MSIYSGDELYDDEVTSGPIAEERDWWQEHKDGVATGELQEGGSAREPEEPDWAYQGLTYPDGSPQEQYHADDPLPDQAPLMRAPTVHMRLPYSLGG